MTTISYPASKIQCGDQIVTNGTVKTVIAIEGPDRIGTYDVFCQDDHGHKTQEIINGTVTITR